MAKGKTINGTPVVLVGFGSELLDQLSEKFMEGLQQVLQDAALTDILSGLSGAFGAEPPPRPRRTRARAR